MNPTLFREQLEKKILSQSYIFEGDEKFLADLSKEFISSVLNPKNDFKISREISENTHPDLLIIDSERNTIPIDSIRKMIDYVQIKPLISKYKLVIINGGQYLRKESSNALLKTLEESFEYVIICILVNSRYKLIPTIRSRCLFVSATDYTKKYDYVKYEKLLDIVSSVLKKDLSVIYDSKNRDYLLSLKEDEEFLPFLYEFFKDFYIFSGERRVPPVRGGRPRL